MALHSSEQPEPGEEKRPRPGGMRRVSVRAAPDDVIVRLERLEAIVTAIAEHLGIGLDRLSGRGRSARRAGGAGRGPTPDAAHAVVRIVARGLLGRIKIYDASRGYGFVVSPDAEGDVFFHRSDCRDDPSTLEQGAQVGFDLVEMANGQVKAVRMGRRAGGQRPPLRPTPRTAPEPPSGEPSP